MNSKEYRPPHQAINLELEGTDPLIDEIIADVIRKRIKNIAAKTSDTYSHARKKHTSKYADMFQNKANILSQMPELWLPVDGKYFISDAIVKACYTHVSGNVQSDRNSSVFWAMRKDVVQKRWNISPISVTHKQKYQFWDYDFVLAIMESIQMDVSSESKLHNKISYHLSESIFPEQLISLRNHVHLEFASMILHSRSNEYDAIGRIHSTA